MSTITSIKPLENFDDFSKVFKVFESFPFFEKWTTEEIRQEFEVNQNNGHIFGYYEDGSCVGFVSMREQLPVNIPMHFGHKVTKVLYIADIAVLPKYRHHGIATTLLEYALNTAKSENFSYAYFRINENNPMAMGIVKKQGFRKEYDLFEIDTHPHIDNKLRTNEEFRVFMTKKL